jgi:D-glycero-D-manno-heptose 1,7-bisphosphate phosphatase
MTEAHARVVLLDRDGIINRMRTDYVKSWEELELVPGSLDAVARLSAAGREVIIVTNQSAIGRGLVSVQTVDEIHRRLEDAIRERGGSVRAFLLCPHTPLDGCDCRKPRPGLLLRARDELGVDLGSAVMIGDQLTDVEAARAAGCRAILVDADGDVVSGAADCTVVRSLDEAIDLILGDA